MTDEEMAEEYSTENWEYYEEGQNDSKALKQAFLAGLKAGRPQWHKVADGTIPKENKRYLVQIKDNGLAIAYFNGQHWETRYNLGESGHCVETVIAWREIPTFEE